MDSNIQNYVKSVEECFFNITDRVSIGHDKFCNVTTDSVTCWPATPAGQVVKRPCPGIFGASPGTYAFKRCGLDGKWAESPFWKGFGHTDYSRCVSHLTVIKDVFGVERETLVKTVGKEINSKDIYIIIIVLVILALSLVFLSVSFVVISCIMPKKLTQSPNYKIWKHLFAAVILETSCQTISQAFSLLNFENNELLKTPICESFITCTEYMMTASYMWIVIQTHHQRLTAQSMRLCSSGLITYIMIGWGMSAIPAVIWSVTSSLSYEVTCWHGYQFQWVIWIMVSPRLLIISIALLFLVQAFLRMSEHKEMLHTNCCYRRLYLESVGTAIYLVYVVCLSAVDAVYHVIPSSTGDDSLCNLRCVLFAAKGIVLALLMLCFNTDIRGLIERHVRRFSRQELVPTTIQENEV